MTCHGFEKLTDYVDGRLSTENAEAVASHLMLGCARCGSDVTWYESVRAIVAADDQVEPPAWVLKRALKVFEGRPWRSEVLARAGRVGQLIAELVFDNMRGPALAGARSSGADARQLLYRAEDYSIDLQLASTGDDEVRLTGQILREGEFKFESVARQALHLTRSGQQVVTTFTNDRGEFEIEQVERGNYDLNIDIAELSITIVGLPIARR